MPPPGRRRTGAHPSPSLLLALLVLCFTSAARAAGSVLGIDFGTLNLKAALVKPGIPLEIVLTKDSKRKEASAVAFKINRDVVPEAGKFPERLYGGDALALQGRMPAEVFPNLKPLLGLAFVESEDGSRPIQDYRERYPAVQLEQVPQLGTTLLKSAAFVQDELPWSVEELLAMELASIRQNAEAMAGKGTSVEAAVITVPAFYTADERRAIERAAVLAGLDVNAFVSDGLAVGIDYAKSRTFPEVSKGEKPEYHLVFDMGAGSTTATLLRFQSRSVKDVGRFNKTVQEVAVVGTGWDRFLGGDALTNVIVEDYVLKFLTKPVLKSRGTTRESIRSNGRLMSRLWKEADKTRQVLSANTETSSSFEELLPEIDFKVKITRSDFEDLASGFAERVSKPIMDALTAAKLEMSDVDSVILHGGAIRTPFVQKKLEEVAGGSAKLRSNVNADESAVFGAAFKGASLSPSFKVKEIRDSDTAGYAAGMQYADGARQRRQVLFSATSPVGSGASTKQVSFKEKDDFAFDLYQVIDDIERPIWGIQTANLTAGVRQLKTKFGCEKEVVSTKFSVRLSPVNGMPEVVRGVVSCEFDGDSKADSLGDSVKDWLGFGKKKDQDPLAEGEDSDVGPTEEIDAATASPAVGSKSPPTSAVSQVSSKASDKPKKTTESIPVAFTFTPKGNPQPSEEEMDRMRDRLAAFDRSDRARMAREEALNVLEAYTYYVRDFLDNADYASFSTGSQRDAISDSLASTREFMENTRDTAKEVFVEKYRALKELVDPVQSRRQESLQRPEKVKALRSSLDQTAELVEMVKRQVEQAEDAKRQAEEWDASHPAGEDEAATSATPSASANALDDLEEAGSQDASPTTEPVPQYTNANDFSAYTEVDQTEIMEAHESTLAWLDEKEAAQAQLQAHEDPVLLVREIEKKAADLGQIMRELLYKKKQHESKTSSKSSKTKNNKTASSKGKKGKTTSTSSLYDSEVPTAAPTAPADGETPEQDVSKEDSARAKESQSSSSSVRDEL